MELYSVPVIFLIVFTSLGAGVVVGFSFDGKSGPTQTVTGLAVTSVTTATETQTTTQTTTAISITTLTDTTSTTLTTTTTSLTSITLTKTLGTGITVTDYKLFMTNVAKDSVLKLNLTVNFAAVNYPTYVTEQAIMILTPTNGNAADIKFAPNPIITQSSGLTLTLTMFTVITHQVVAGTYMIEYAISTSQGSALVFTVLEIT